MRVNVTFNSQRKTANGEYSVCLYVYHNGKKFYVNTGLKSKVVFADGLFPKSEKNFKAKTIRLNNLITQTEEILLTHPTESIEDLKKRVRAEVFGKTVKTDKTTLSSAIQIFSDTKKGRTKEIYTATLNKIASYAPDVTLDDIDTCWLDDWRQSMSMTLCVNALSIHMRNLRAVFNWCVNHKMTTNYPFKGYRIPREETRKRNLSIEDIKHIRDMEVKPHQEKYRDLFMLMFYLIGINAVDLLNAKQSQLHNGRLEYCRAKTSKLYSIKIEPEAMNILEKYKGKSYLLRFAETSFYRHFLKHMNDCLDELYEGVTSYYARHSWATIAYELDIPIDTISQALGHSHGSRVTIGYINQDPKKVDVANRKVLDVLL